MKKKESINLFGILDHEQSEQNQARDNIWIHNLILIRRNIENNLGIHNLMKCKFCESIDCVLIKTTHNLNLGDGLIDPHAHLNFFYRCNGCNREFVVRMWFGISELFEKLYYGDIVNGRAVDMSMSTQEEVHKFNIEGKSHPCLRDGIMRPVRVVERWKRLIEDFKSRGLK